MIFHLKSGLFVREKKVERWPIILKKNQFQTIGGLVVRASRHLNPKLYAFRPGIEATSGIWFFIWNRVFLLGKRKLSVDPFIKKKKQWQRPAVAEWLGCRDIWTQAQPDSSTPSDPRSMPTSGTWFCNLKTQCGIEVGTTFVAGRPTSISYRRVK